MATLNQLAATKTQTVSRRTIDRFQHNIGRWLPMAFLAVMAIFTLMPFVWVVSTSLRTPAQSFTVPPQGIPVDMDFSKYTRVFQEIPFWLQLIMSFVIIIS